MAKTSDVVMTVYKENWKEFAETHKANPFVKCARVSEYPSTDLVNVSWEFIKWYTKDEYIDEIIEYFNDHDFLLTTLDDDNTVFQQDHISDDNMVSEFWDYAPQVKLVV